MSLIASSVFTPGIPWKETLRGRRTYLRPSSAPRSYEDGIAFGLQQLRAFNPTHIIGCLGPQSLEILRYVPKGISRLGMVQTDDPLVYRMLGQLRSSAGCNRGAFLSTRVMSSAVLRGCPANRSTTNPMVSRSRQNRKDLPLFGINRSESPTWAGWSTSKNESIFSNRFFMGS